MEVFMHNIKNATQICCFKSSFLFNFRQRSLLRRPPGAVSRARRAQYGFIHAHVGLARGTQMRRRIFRARDGQPRSRLHFPRGSHRCLGAEWLVHVQTQIRSIHLFKLVLAFPPLLYQIAQNETSRLRSQVRSALKL